MKRFLAIVPLLLRALSRRITGVCILWRVAASFLVAIAAVVSYAETPDPELMKRGLEALGPQDRRIAFPQFVDVFQIVKPHPDAAVQRFIDRARMGDPGAFALVANLIWHGDVGFRQDKVSAKIALTRAMVEGSDEAPYFIAFTFLWPENVSKLSDNEKIDALLIGIHWLGISAGMGNKLAHAKAMNLIDGLAKKDPSTRAPLVSMYNKGLENSKQYKRQ